MHNFEENHVYHSYILSNFWLFCMIYNCALFSKLLMIILKDLCFSRGDNVFVVSKGRMLNKLWEIVESKDVSNNKG